ncbi:hypothetical protein AMK13_03880 [Streptomyces sp. CB02056]|nr:hypothetical protein AMK13_03880 [Streptomyces sp. CB02056]
MSDGSFGMSSSVLSRSATVGFPVSGTGVSGAGEPAAAGESEQAATRRTPAPSARRRGASRRPMTRAAAMKCRNVPR